MPNVFNRIEAYILVPYVLHLQNSSIPELCEELTWILLQVVRGPMPLFPLALGWRNTVRGEHRSSLSMQQDSSTEQAALPEGWYEAEDEASGFPVSFQHGATHFQADSTEDKLSRTQAALILSAKCLLPQSWKELSGYLMAFFVYSYLAVVFALSYP